MKFGTHLIVLMASVVSVGLTPVEESALPAQSGPCPADYPPLRAFVERILASQEMAEVRDRLGLSHVADQSLRVLGSSREDYPVCARLYQRVPKGYKVRGKNATDTVVFYRTGDRYILALTSAPLREGELPIPGAPDQYAGFDLNLNEIGRVIFR